MARVTNLLVNGAPHKVDADSQSTLLSVLREQLELTGTKYGCGEGQCGACTVLLDGVPRRSCLTPVGDTEGKAVTTIEGLAQNSRLHPLQEAFLAEEAMQCAYCTSGMTKMRSTATSAAAVRIRALLLLSNARLAR